MNKTLTSVEEISKEDKAYLRFKYNDNTHQDYLISEERTISKDNETHYLIDEKNKEEQLNKRLKTGDFQRCIFLIAVNFFKEKFTNNVNFSLATFTQAADFSFATFTQIAKFSSATFTQNADFRFATFTQNADFRFATFTQNADFLSATFTQTADFRLATFTQTADFLSATFDKTLSLTAVKQVKLNLKHTIVERIEYGEAKFSADNRETFLTLKNVALKQNDQIRALEFHQQEYQTHYQKLNWKQLDKWVLGFEFWASMFGLSAIRAIMRLIGTVALFYVLINGFNYDTRAIIDFASPLGYDIDKIFTCGIDWWDRYLFFFYKILQVVLIYEIIKSFRKFSRRL